MYVTEDGLVCERCEKMGKKKIEIKDVTVLKALFDKVYHPALQDIIFWVAEIYGLCITEGWRVGKGVHSTDPVRGIDLRSWFYRPALATEIEEGINERWEYDFNRPKKKVAWIHNSGQGIHFHIQVHPNTKRRKEDGYRD